MKRILFVCLGNICRSPAAEGVMRHLVESSNRQDEFLIASAGTASYHVGCPADARMREAASRRGYHLDGRARHASPRDLSEFDLIVAMDRENYRALQKLGTGTLSHIRLLSDYLDDSWPQDVPDPYYGGPEGFEKVLDMLEAACPKILASFKEKSGL